MTGTDRLSADEREVAHRLLQPLATVLERLTDEELGHAREAFAKASETNCWYLIFCLRREMLPIIAHEAASRGLTAQGTPTRRAETTGSVGEADGGPVAEGHAPEPCIASPNPTTQGESK